MPRAYLDKAGNYYESDGDFGDTPVPARPSVDHAWDGTAWVLSDALRNARIGAEREDLARPLAGPAIRALIEELAARFGITPDALRQAIRARL